MTQLSANSQPRDFISFRSGNDGRPWNNVAGARLWSRRFRSRRTRPPYPRQGRGNPTSDDRDSTRFIAVASVRYHSCTARFRLPNAQDRQRSWRFLSALRRPPLAIRLRTARNPAVCTSRAELACKLHSLSDGERPRRTWSLTAALAKRQRHSRQRFNGMSPENAA